MSEGIWHEDNVVQLGKPHNFQGTDNGSVEPLDYPQEGYGLKNVQLPDSGEMDPNGLCPHSSGAKLDAGKTQSVRYVLNYFPDAIEEVSRVSEFGARKYVEGGWRTVSDGVTRYTEALGRHLLAEGKGELVDRDSGLAHAAHAAWNALARLQLVIDNLNRR